MGIAQKNDSDHSIESLLSFVRLALRALRFVAGILEGIEHVATEYARLRVAIRRAGPSLDVPELISSVETDYPILAEVLRRSEIERYELGRLWVKVANDIDANTLGLFSGILRDLLKTKHGVKLNLRILRDQ